MGEHATPAEPDRLSSVGPATFAAMSPVYMFASVCERGHVVTADAKRFPNPPHCDECGATTLQACPACGEAILGPQHWDSELANVKARKQWVPPKFCRQCGAPFPWVDRTGRIYELENRLVRENLAPAEQLAAREQLQALLDPDLSEDEQRKRWERVFKFAPGLRENAAELVRSVATAAVLRQLGL
jgi:hypothetical protein